jgi:hypothetical protein
MLLLPMFEKEEGVGMRPVGVCVLLLLLMLEKEKGVWMCPLGFCVLPLLQMFDHSEGDKTGLRFSSGLLHHLHY